MSTKRTSPNRRHREAEALFLGAAAVLALFALLLLVAVTVAHASGYEDAGSADALLEGAEICNVQAYGAIGDNSTDDTTAIQAAVNACGARAAVTGDALSQTVCVDPTSTRFGQICSTNNTNASTGCPATCTGTCCAFGKLGGVVYFPAGYYKITAPIDLTACTGCWLHGDGPATTDVRQYTATSSVFKINATGSGVVQYVSVSDMNVVAQGTAGTGFDLTGNFFGSLRDIHITYSAIGIKATAVAELHIERAVIDSTGATPTAGIEADFGAGTIIGPLWVDQTTIRGGQGPAVIFTDGGSAYFKDCFFSMAGAATAPALIDLYGNSFPNYGQVIFDTVHIENAYNLLNTAALFRIGFGADFGSVTIINSLLGVAGNLGHPAAYGVRMYGGDKLVVEDNVIGLVGAASGPIRLESGWPAAGDKISFRNNVNNTGNNLYSDADGIIPATYSGDIVGDTLFERAVTIANAKGLRLNEAVANGTNYVELVAPASISNNSSMTFAAITGIRTWTFPDETGTVCTTGSVCTGYAASTSDVTAVGNCTSGACLIEGGSGSRILLTPTDAPATCAVGIRGSIYMDLSMDSLCTCGTASGSYKWCRSWTDPGVCTGGSDTSCG